MLIFRKRPFLEIRIPCGPVNDKLFKSLFKIQRGCIYYSVIPSKLLLQNPPNSSSIAFFIDFFFAHNRYHDGEYIHSLLYIYICAVGWNGFVLICLSRWIPSWTLKENGDLGFSFFWWFLAIFGLMCGIYLFIFWMR